MASRASINASSAKPPPQRPIMRAPTGDPGDAVADLDHLAGALTAARLGRGAVAATQELTPVQRRGAHAHQDLAGLRLGRSGLAKLDSGRRRGRG